jgi:hypothetical protein
MKDKKQNKTNKQTNKQTNKSELEEIQQQQQRKDVTLQRERMKIEVE